MNREELLKNAKPILFNTEVELFKNAKPILFNTEMVQAILEGRKTVTRRVLKKQPIYEKNSAYMGGGVYRFEHYGFDLSKDWTNINLAKSEGKNIPFEVGDIIYVRETFRYVSIGEETYEGECLWQEEVIEYKASQDEFEKQNYDYIGEYYKWHPSIHMPKSIARIFLKVTNIRVERLQDITEEQAEKEGFYIGYQSAPTSTFATTARQAFMWVWNKIYSDINPWVWVIDFERAEVD